MKTIVRVILAVLLLTCAASTASYADGGSPPPMCKPGQCPNSPIGL